MKLEAKSSYKSILPFGPVDLPNFIVLIGRNGAGKSHFLEGISKTAIIASEMPISNREGSSKSAGGALDHDTQSNTTVLIQSSDSISYSGQHARLPSQGSNPVYGSFRRVKSHIIEDLVAEMKELFSIGDGNDSLLESLFGMTENQAAEALRSLAPKATHDYIRTMFDRANAMLLDTSQWNFNRLEFVHKANTLARHIQFISNTHGKEAREVTYNDLSEIFSLGLFETFNPDIPALFDAYRSARDNNDLARAAHKRDTITPFLSDEEFLRQHGPPPWEQMSELIKGAGLPFDIVEPPWRPGSDSAFRLLHSGNQVELSPDELSSGERVMLRFALSIFKYDPVRIQLQVPKLLLLDEMDASLHPEFTQNWLRFIQGELVGKNEIACILTTHSPTTVALAPEESLFEITAGKPGLTHVTKPEAINQLTVGVPTLSIGYSGKRIVFTEANSDAIVYTKLMQVMKDELALPRSLVFIDGETRYKGAGSVGSGKDRVKLIVNKFNELEISPVYGIIDWDGKNNPKGHVFVSGCGQYYTIENILSDPLLVGVLIIRRGGQVLGSGLEYDQVPRATQAELQQLSSAVQRMIKPDLEATDLYRTAHYFGGHKINVNEYFQRTDGKEVAKEFINAHADLNDWYGASGNPDASAKTMMCDIVDRVISDHPSLCPMSICDLFTRIATHGD